MGELYEKIFNYDNLLDAHCRARRNKRYRGEVLDFSYNLFENLLAIQNELIYKVYKPGGYIKRVIYEPKRREIVSLPYRDRVVQHAIHNVIEPLFDSRMIYDTYACRKGKGTHKALKRLSYFLGKPGMFYYGKIDVHKYFASINHNILKGFLRRGISDCDVLDLLDRIIDDFSPGLPIGNLTSQLFANIYLGEIDFMVKEQMCCKCYVRYMDDIIFLCETKRAARAIFDLIGAYLRVLLALDLNPKSCIGVVRDGIDFLGCRVYPGRRVVKKSTLARLKRKFKAWERGKIESDKFIKMLASAAAHVQDTGSRKQVNRIMLQVMRKVMAGEVTCEVTC